MIECKNIKPLVKQLSSRTRASSFSNDTQQQWFSNEFVAEQSSNSSSSSLLTEKPILYNSPYLKVTEKKTFSEADAEILFREEASELLGEGSEKSFPDFFELPPAAAASTEGVKQKKIVIYDEGEEGLVIEEDASSTSTSATTTPPATVFANGSDEKLPPTTTQRQHEQEQQQQGSDTQVPLLDFLNNIESRISEFTLILKMWSDTVQSLRRSTEPEIVSSEAEAVQTRIAQMLRTTLGEIEGSNEFEGGHHPENNSPAVAEPLSPRDLASDGSRGLSPGFSWAFVDDQQQSTRLPASTAPPAHKTFMGSSTHATEPESDATTEKHPVDPQSESKSVSGSKPETKSETRSETKSKTISSPKAAEKPCDTEQQQPSVGTGILRGGKQKRPSGFRAEFEFKKRKKSQDVEGGVPGVARKRGRPKLRTSNPITIDHDDGNITMTEVLGNEGKKKKQRQQKKQESCQSPVLSVSSDSYCFCPFHGEFKKQHQKEQGKCRSCARERPFREIIESTKGAWRLLRFRSAETDMIVSAEVQCPRGHELTLRNPLKTPLFCLQCEKLAAQREREQREAELEHFRQEREREELRNAERRFLQEKRRQLPKDYSSKYANMDNTAACKDDIQRVLCLKNLGPFTVLSVGLPPSSSSSSKLKEEWAANVKAHYRKLVRSIHPDKNSSPQAKEAFNVVQDAWEQLKVYL